MANLVTLSVFSGGRLRRSARSGIAINISLLLLMGPTTAAYGLRDSVQDRISERQQPGAVISAMEQKDNSAVTLEPGKPIEREIAGGASHTYQISLAAGEFFHAVFDQRGVNLIITLYGSDGKKIADIDSPLGAQGPEPVSLIAEISGIYRLEARPWQQSAPKGRYQAKIEELRAATPQDKVRVAAERAFSEATLIGDEGTAESLRKAIEKYGEVIPLWQSLGDRQQEGYTLTTIGYCYGNLGEYRKALDYYQRALPLKQAVNDRSGEALALYKIGSAYDNLGEPQKALEHYNRALSINRAIPDQSMEAATLGNMGVIYSGLGDQQKALELFNQALTIKQALPDPYGVATLLNNIGLVNNYLDDTQKALEFYDRAITAYRALNDRAGEGATLNNIATLYSELGDRQKALGFLEQALQIKRTSGNRVSEAIALNNIGVAYGYLGEHQKALEYYNQALPLSRGASSAEATTLSNIGKSYSDLSDYRKALDFFNQSLPLQRACGDRRGEAVTLTNIGRAYHGLGEYDKALDYCAQALTIRREVIDRGGEAVTRYNIACIQRDLNNLTEARAQIEKAIAIIESLRSKVTNQGLRASYLASVQKYYELDVDLLMRLHRQQPSEGFAAAALHMCERGRARTLLEMLAEARANIRQGVSPSLLERERALQQSLQARSVAQMRLLSGKPTAEQSSAIAKEIDALTTEYEQVQAQIRLTSPRYAALTQPAPLSVKEIQTDMLDPDTLLLEYAMGEEKSYLWAVTPTSIRSFELPKRVEIEKAARRVYEILTSRNRSGSNETPQQRRRRLDSADIEYPKASAVLSRMLLGPVASQLENKRLLVVCDGMLQYLPFGSLPLPQKERRSGGETARPDDGSTAGFTPLIVEHEVISLPSASVLAALRRETAGRRSAAKTLAVIADPVYRADDPRIGAIARSRSSMVDEVASTKDVQRSAAESGLEDFVRLRFSRQEADEITRLASDDLKLKALDFAASKATVTNADLDQYRIVHFATHGLINSAHPELSGIVLSLVDEEGRPQNGFLRLYEIYNLKLEADLVVLSACQTALGKEVKGEGLIGLTRGFMYAGAPRIVASLWQIDDRVTAELMKRFYQGMLGDGLAPPAALRAAQVSMWRDKRWQTPYYWAAFTFQGEWK